MDSLDIKILKLLQNNARITASEISSRVNLSVPAVSDRLRKLDASGVIEKYTIIINGKKLNRNLAVIMFITLESPKYTTKFLEAIQKEDEIIECHYVAGDYDYVLKIITENTETLEAILNKIKGMSGIAKTKTTVTLSTIKNNYSIMPKEEDYL
ncbi:Lrp/AsnC family transcriptional regulator [Clostridium sp. CX1]|uniref:Lrp/AsnC family transcriptional regulator n=1 Tax=Clostridium tanneri TaxID=3037988 RepID=A0ABU4JV38_9CLOT|nr:MULTISPECIES: Lrp/AsnC family transcriptional regulator [unclassified Clostridium]MCT8975612.1 Lrp/AsnC family transcriptional regulator [Clostridium sp. CX1]MDW8802012.1 Lrp/AsnC family transcriptional regulator [Clostridium sp. A1-XYC3]